MSQVIRLLQEPPEGQSMIYILPLSLRRSVHILSISLLCIASNHILLVVLSVYQFAMHTRTSNHIRSFCPVRTVLLKEGKEGELECGVAGAELGYVSGRAGPRGRCRIARNGRGAAVTRTAHPGVRGLKTWTWTWTWT